MKNLPTGIPIDRKRTAPSGADYILLLERTEQLAEITGLRRNEQIIKIPHNTQQEIDAKAEESDVVKHDGSVEMTGPLILGTGAKVIEHISIPATNWHFGASAPAENDVGIFHTLAFDAASDDEVHHNHIIPFRIDAGSTITVIVDWCYTGGQDNGTVCWALEYLTIADGETVDGSTTTINVTTAGSHPTGKKVSSTLNTGIVGAVGHDTLGMRLYRDVSEDSLNTDAELLKVHLDVTCDKLGEAV